jgi:hypothetical protein
MTQDTAIFPELHGHQYMSLITLRKNGAAIPTTVWFAIEDGKLYVLTGKKTGKYKRIRNNPRVQLAACNMFGNRLYSPYVEGRARIMAPEEEHIAKAALNRKYGLWKNVSDFIDALTGQDKTFVHLEIVPA